MSVARVPERRDGWRLVVDLVGQLQLLADDAGLTDLESDVWVRVQIVATEIGEKPGTLRVRLYRARARVTRHLTATGAVRRIRLTRRARALGERPCDQDGWPANGATVNLLAERSR